MGDLFTVALYPEEPPKPAAGSAHVWVMIPDRHDAWAITEWACREGIELSQEQVALLCAGSKGISIYVETVTDDDHPWLVLADDPAAVADWCAERGVVLSGPVDGVPVSVVDVPKARCAAAWVKFEITEKHLGKVLAMG